MKDKDLQILWDTCRIRGIDPLTITKKSLKAALASMHGQQGDWEPEDNSAAVYAHYKAKMDANKCKCEKCQCKESE